MEKVTGIGGLFFTSEDPEGVARWYAEKLGIPGPPASYDELPWWQEAGPTVLAVMPRGGLGDSGATWSLNLRVRDLHAMVEQLRASRVEVEIDPEVYPNGRFANLRDPEGRPIQLWEPQGAEGRGPA